MLTIRRSQLAQLGAVMLERFIDAQTARAAAALSQPADAALRARVRDAVASARADGLVRVDDVGAHVARVLGIDQGR